ncbi:MAG: hypothetical protein R3B13_07825 [Polyangiaceae bacterium]
MAQATEHRWLPTSGLVWALLPSVALSAALAARPSPPHDYWWPLVQGRLFALHGLPSVDGYLYSLPPGTEFINQQWLAHWLLFVSYRLGNHAGVALTTSLACLLGWGLVCHAAHSRGGNSKTALGAAAVAVVFLSPSLVPRAQTLALPFFAVSLWLCLAVADQRLAPRALLGLVPVTALWANVHGSFVLAWVLFGAAALATLRRVDVALRRSAVALLLACAAGLGLASVVSPNGFDTLLHVTRISHVRAVSEWQPLDPTTREGGIALAALLGVGLLSWLRRSRVALHDALLLIVFSLLALKTWRGMLWWAVLLPVVVAPLFAASPTTPSRSWLHAAAASICVLFVVSCLPGVGMRQLRLRFGPTAKPTGEGAGYLTLDSPIELVEKARSSGAVRVFHDQKLGGLVEFVLASDQPRAVAFVDQRMELIPERTWHEYFAISAGEDAVASLKRWSVDTVLAHQGEQAGLVRALSAAGYRPAARQGEFVMFSLK